MVSLPENRSEALGLGSWTRQRALGWRGCVRSHCSGKAEKIKELQSSRAKGVGEGGGHNGSKPAKPREFWSAVLSISYVALGSLSVLATCPVVALKNPDTSHTRKEGLILAQRPALWKTWRQERKTASHSASATRKQSSACSLRSLQPKPPACVRASPPVGRSSPLSYARQV